MRTIPLIIVFAILFCSISSAQTYDLKNYSNGTQTVEVLKSRYSQTQIKKMLENAELCKSIDPKRILGIKLQDENTLENILITDTDSVLMLFEYIKKLKQEIAILNQRLQTAGIP